MISFQPAQNLKKAAQITYDNMRQYYDHYSVGWDLERILEQTTDLNNWDILYKGKHIGVLRLAIDSQGCYIRDLQVIDHFQNQGIGAQAIEKATQIARQSGINKLKLRVFKISPAFHLYKRSGFIISHEDDRFYYMEREVYE